MKEFESKFQEKLDQVYEWPATYTFKFVVPKSQHSQLLSRVPHGELSERPSSSGKYVAVTIKSKMASAKEVVSIYKKMSVIEGVLSL